MIVTFQNRTQNKHGKLPDEELPSTLRVPCWLLGSVKIFFDSTRKSELGGIQAARRVAEQSVFGLTDEQQRQLRIGW